MELYRALKTGTYRSLFCLLELSDLAVGASASSQKPPLLYDHFLRKIEEGDQELNIYCERVEHLRNEAAALKGRAVVTPGDVCRMERDLAMLLLRMDLTLMHMRRLVGFAEHLDALIRQCSL